MQDQKKVGYDSWLVKLLLWSSINYFGAIYLTWSRSCLFRCVVIMNLSCCNMKDEGLRCQSLTLLSFEDENHLNGPFYTASDQISFGVFSLFAIALIVPKLFFNLFSVLTKSSVKRVLWSRMERPYPLHAWRPVYWDQFPRWRNLRLITCPFGCYRMSLSEFEILVRKAICALLEAFTVELKSSAQDLSTGSSCG